MAEILEKLRPDRDLQVYFERPSAIAAFSESSPTGFRVSGNWRQQFDWAVVEWNKHNVIEHPLFRNLPDGNLSGLVLSYEETRNNCIPMDSDLFPTVDWPFLRVWTRYQGAEDFYKVRLKDYAIPIEGSYVPAKAELQLQGTITAGDYVGISFQTEHYTYQVTASDTLESAAQAVVDIVNTFSTALEATRIGSIVELFYVGPGQTMATSTTGANGNRLGAYGFVSGAQTESWSPQFIQFSGGQSPSKWRVTLPLNNLTAIDSRTVPADRIRKMRWTYSAELQPGAYQRSEFVAEVSNWTVTGTGRQYRVAGPGSRRIEDDDSSLVYTGSWDSGRGNFSGGTIRSATNAGASVRCQYRSPQTHELYLGTRFAFNGCQVSISVDGGPAVTENLFVAGEDTLVRIPLGVFGPGTHTVVATHNGPQDSYFYFDFVEVAIPANSVSQVPADNKVTLATDWDTDHSLAVSPERTAWMIYSLGFWGRANHYVGALVFYDLVCDGNVYASTTVDFVGTPVFSEITELRIGRVGEPPSSDAVIQHVNRIGDSAVTIAKAFEMELNRGYTAIRAAAQGTQLTIFARAMGTEGNHVTVAGSPASGDFRLEVASGTLAGGTDGTWHTDLQALPRINRAARDWSRSFYKALKLYNIDVAAAFSMELQHGDTSVAAGIAQRYPNGAPALLNTPALQTNFSPTSTNFWKQVYLEMATLMGEANVQPYLQFGEVQWWYFPLAGSGLPFYDEYTTSEFQARYGRPMAVISSNTVDPALHPEEVEFLPALIGEFTTAVMQFVKATHASCRFEVLYPPDVNHFPFTGAINYPATWTPANLDCLKTESFTFTFERNLDLARMSIEYGEAKGFPRSQRSFLVGIMDAYTAWGKEVNIAKSENVESVVLFALDQFCLIGYPAPMPASLRRCAFLG
ncbi:MAG: hypothetical protein FJW20_02435 [Acidimicrobiia bacterium]|nr:hypothetical protein [Acidimicrobiia bacterium]